MTIVRDAFWTAATVNLWALIGVTYALVWRLDVHTAPALLVTLLAGVATFRLMTLAEMEQPRQRVHIDTRAIPVNRVDGRRDTVTIESSAGAIRDWEDDLPIVAAKWRHYLMYCHAEGITPSMRTATDQHEYSMSREEYRALFRWLVDTGWYEVNNRTDKYNNQQGGIWTVPNGERAIEALADGVHPSIVLARYTRPAPNGAGRYGAGLPEVTHAHTRQRTRVLSA